ncbi:MAG: DinB family protein [Bacteroidota bacterium]
MYKPHSQQVPDYYQTYVGKVPDHPLVETLTEGQQQTESLLQSLTEEQWLHRYASGKWSLKESFLHMIDAERVFIYRAMRIARGDQTPLPGFDQNAYVPNSDADQRSPESLLTEYRAVRSASIALFQSMKEDALERVGTASNHPFTPKVLGYVTAGHELHHLKLFREKYLG